MCVVAWLLRLSSLVNFISETILLGFKAGAALTIAMTQLPRLFGVKGGGHGFFESAVTLGRQLPDTNLAVLAFGLAALAVLLLGERPGAPTRRVDHLSCREAPAWQVLLPRHNPPPQRYCQAIPIRS
jgi:SulP family sulfate permease